MYGYIYLTTNTVNGKIYVGQHRSQHFDKNYRGSGVILKQALRKYGVDKFDVKVLQWADSKEDLDAKEAYWIQRTGSRNPDVGVQSCKR